MVEAETQLPESVQLVEILLAFEHHKAVHGQLGGFGDRKGMEGKKAPASPVKRKRRAFVHAFVFVEVVLCAGHEEVLAAGRQGANDTEVSLFVFAHVVERPHGYAFKVGVLVHHSRKNIGGVVAAKGKNGHVVKADVDLVVVGKLRLQSWVAHLVEVLVYVFDIRIKILIIRPIDGSAINRVGAHLVAGNGEQRPAEVHIREPVGAVDDKTCIAGHGLCALHIGMFQTHPCLEQEVAW